MCNAKLYTTVSYSTHHYNLLINQIVISSTHFVKNSPMEKMAAKKAVCDNIHIGGSSDNSDSSGSPNRKSHNLAVTITQNENVDTTSDVTVSGQAEGKFSSA